MTLFANRFRGKSAIVTGGASGLGLEVATRIVAEGGKVVLWDINPEALAAAQKSSGAHSIHAVDVSNHAAVVQAAKDSFAALGRIDILVASAGITGATVPVSEFPVESWLRVIDVNLNGLFYCCREVLPFMAQNGYGRIVNIASVAGMRAVGTGRTAYGTSKGAVIALTRQMAVELAEHGITANAVSPGPVDTPMTQALHTAKFREEYSKAIPMNRYGSTGEIAAAVMYLVSEEARYTTGISMPVDGGFLASGARGL